MPFAHSLSVNVPVEPNGIARIIGLMRCRARSTSSTTPSLTVCRKGPGRPGKPWRR
jgi:hypothetical protein